jgi:hypothetical protein
LHKEFVDYIQKINYNLIEKKHADEIIKYDERKELGIANPNMMNGYWFYLIMEVKAIIKNSRKKVHYAALVQTRNFRHHPST